MIKLVQGLCCLLGFSFPAFAEGAIAGNIEVAKSCGQVRDFILEVRAVVATSPGGNDLASYEQRFVKAYENIYLFDMVRGNQAEIVLDDPVTGFSIFDAEVRKCLQAGSCNPSVIATWSTQLGMDLHDACKKDFRGLQ